jgi:hypothetical protein
MTTQEENETIHLTPPDIPKASWLIKKCVNGVSKDEVLTTITDIDLFKEILEANIEALETYRKVLLNRAIAENIKEDSGAVLVEIPGKKIRCAINNIEAFRATFPHEYNLIRDVQKETLTRKYNREFENIESAQIPLGIADEILGDYKVTDFVGYKPQEVKVIIQRKRGTRTELLG